MAIADSGEITRLLVQWSEGEKAAFDTLMPLVHEELHRLAARYIRRENPGHTLQTTALVNEAYLKLINQRSVNWQNRAHFFGIAAQLMRRILMKYARDKFRLKRGGDVRKVVLDETALVSLDLAEEFLLLDDALTRLEEMDPRKSRIVEMRFFAGMSTEEIAEVEKVSARTVEREWRKAKAWLHQTIRGTHGA